MIFEPARDKVLLVVMKRGLKRKGIIIPETTAQDALRPVICKVEAVGCLVSDYKVGDTVFVRSFDGIRFPNPDNEKQEMLLIREREIGGRVLLAEEDGYILED